jgi:hypothetical protein
VAHPAVERLTGRAEPIADLASGVEVAGVGESRVLDDGQVARTLIESQRRRGHQRLKPVLDGQVEPVALGGVRHDDPVAGQLLDAQQVVGALRVLDGADGVEVGELRDQLRRKRVRAYRAR